MTDFSKQTKVDKSLSITDRIGFLRYCASSYEHNGSSPISDKDYDIEYAECERLAPDDKFFNEVGGNLEDGIHGTRVAHKIVMGSLSKARNIDEFRTWLKSQYASVKDPQFVLQLKIDGLSLSNHYKNGKLTQSLTRGDGETGILAVNAQYVDGIKTSIQESGEFEVRGECYKDRFDFNKNWHKSVRPDGFANARNFTPGSLLQHDPEVTKERKLSFIAYEVVGMNFATEADKELFLQKLGFNTLKTSTRLTKKGLSLNQIGDAVEEYMNSIDRANLPFDIDGIVVKLNDVKTAKSMGSNAGGRKPKSSIAVKFPAEEKQTKIIGVDTKVNRTGIVSPVAILEPVELGGAMIGRASLYNFGNVKNNPDIRIGSVVIVKKAGDIIPIISSVVKAGVNHLPIPTNCPCCNSLLSWDATNVNLICNNVDCSAQLASAIDHWLSNLGVKGVGPGILGKLTSRDEFEWEGHAVVESLPELYYMLDNDRRSEHPFRKYAKLKEFFGEKAYQNIIDSVNSVKEVTLAKFIEALGIGKIGSMAKDIVAIAPTVDAIDKLTEIDIQGIAGFGGVKAKNFIDGWKNKRGQIKTLLKYITIKADVKASTKLVGKKFCFTGSFSKGRDELEKIVEDNGGVASSSVGKDVILVWDGAISGSKLEKAQKNGNKIISESDFNAMI